MHPDTQAVLDDSSADRSTTDLVSIMMPAYNAERFIGQAIESVLAQSYSNWELVVVDDGSTDRTAEVITRYADSRIHPLYQINRGEAAARNLALTWMRGEFIAFLDADDQFRAQHLETTVAYLKDSPDRGAVYTDGHYIDASGNLIATLASRRRGPFEGRIFEQVVRASDVFGPPICAVLRRKAITEHRLRFDTGIVIGPDWDFLTRLAEVTPFGYLNQATCLYRVHQTNITLTAPSQTRQLSLARCRESAIQRPGFKDCSLETRQYVFYDLLVNLLTGFPERQTAITAWPEFGQLPPNARARLLRLMAGRAITQGVQTSAIGQWFRQGLALNPTDVRGQLLATLYRLSPAACDWLLRSRAARQPRVEAASPFGRLE